MEAKWTPKAWICNHGEKPRLVWDDDLEYPRTEDGLDTPLYDVDPSPLAALLSRLVASEEAYSTELSNRGMHEGPSDNSAEAELESVLEESRAVLRGLGL